ncbi:hypothetical protein C8R43DRAFT_696548 [Mycena crocata]|nr:hypothetical protein C8R43DRAFT_696548 [Mycena crocata]
MVLTRRQSKAILRWFPNEILIEILLNATKADQVSLCRVSKLFHKLCLPVLNRVVELDRPGGLDSTTAFCSALIQNPTRAEAIRSFTATIGNHWPPTLVELLLSSLKIMLRLENLEIGGPHDFMTAALTQSTFRRLLGCHIQSSLVTGASTNDVASFLNRHPTITCFVGNYLTIPSVSITAPNLEYYEGIAAWVPKIVAGRLRKARLFWTGSESANSNDTIVALAALADPNKPFSSLHNCHLEQAEKIVTAVALHMPQTMAFQVSCYSNVSAFDFKVSSSALGLR